MTFLEIESLKGNRMLERTVWKHHIISHRPYSVEGDRWFFLGYGARAAASAKCLDVLMEFGNVLPNMRHVYSVPDINVAMSNLAASLGKLDNGQDHSI